MSLNRAFQCFFILLLTAAATSGQSQTTQAKVDRRVIVPNRPSPELYSDNLSLKITLINLPGAKNSAS